jgi:hypothetical protein
MLLNKDQVAARLGTTAGIASRILSEHDVKPIDLGRGRGRGKRWYASAVDAVVYQMHEDAQGKKPSRRKVHVAPHLVLGKTARELYAELTSFTPTQ